MSVFDGQSPQTNFQSGSGFAYVHSRGATVYDVTVACGSVKGTLRIFDSTSSHATCQRTFIRAQVNTAGNPTFQVVYDPPLVCRKKVKVKIMGGGTGASLNGRMVAQIRFVKSTYRASVT